MLLLDIFRGQFIPCFFRIYFFYQNFVCSYNHLKHMQNITTNIEQNIFLVSKFVETFLHTFQKILRIKNFVFRVFSDFFVFRFLFLKSSETYEKKNSLDLEQKYSFWWKILLSLIKLKWKILLEGIIWINCFLQTLQKIAQRSRPKNPI